MASDASAVKIVNNMQEYKAAADVKSKLVVAYHTAKWCGPCQRIWPENLAAKYGDKVSFLKVDVDEADDVAASNSIRAVPTFILLKDGGKVEELVGASSAALVASIDKHVK
ncbi:hypothetical protein GUITHDRAFT_105737 [Guillardia theta CCMP2712]|uniref:Thioredoxin n=1 Tax=Guillardia theta (strain CCMP2712) TaxID=905079 RepID=L1JJT6_GUITC|nr:hypothetical protein GUITHDRAFT_105737 [Guillardia theta CCMP2712]EKX48592.1 hypothetical protein GUITHDRAFT_105737 [Guillardia theta CCMP2712]|eukprot:XP_005835572.1 hypothetical protein GUITHDRAFT_105737 [Guillardia theta CCMP2712]